MKAEDLTLTQAKQLADFSYSPAGPVPDGYEVVGSNDGEVDRGEGEQSSLLRIA